MEKSHIRADNHKEGMYNMKINSKIIITGLILTVFAAIFPVAAEVSFSSYAGGLAGGNWVVNDDSGTDFSIPFKGYAGGQISLGNIAILRGELSIKSKDLTSNDIFKGQDSTLRINELSLTYNKLNEVVTNYFSLFAGNCEGVGSDSSMTRIFGIQKTASHILDTSSGLYGRGLFYYEGVGGSYMAKLHSAPLAGGFSLYFNNEKNDYELKKANLDLRLMCALDLLTIDLAAGAGVPLVNRDKKYEGAFLVIDTVYIHGGASMLLGQNNENSFLVHFGMSDMKPHPDMNGHDFSNDIFSLIVEPRVVIGKTHVRLSFFSLNKNDVDELDYVYDNFGGCLSIYTDSLKSKTSNATLGVNLICSVKDMALLDFVELYQKGETGTIKPNAYVTPFTKIPVFGGEVNLIASFGIIDFMGKFKPDVKASIGYKKTF